MGDIRKYTCMCGYEKEVFAGGGLAGCNIPHIANFFPEGAKALQKEREEGRIKRYLMENEISYCNQCREIQALPVFSYTRKDGYTCRFESNCPVCGCSVSRAEDEENLACPKCGKKMEYSITGDWD